MGIHLKRWNIPKPKEHMECHGFSLQLRGGWATSRIVVGTVPQGKPDFLRDAKQFANGSKFVKVDANQPNRTFDAMQTLAATEPNSRVHSFPPPCDGIMIKSPDAHGHRGQFFRPVVRAQQDGLRSGRINVIYFHLVEVERLDVSVSSNVFGFFL